MVELYADAITMVYTIKCNIYPYVTVTEEPHEVAVKVGHKQYDARMPLPFHQWLLFKVPIIIA